MLHMQIDPIDRIRIITELGPKLGKIWFKGIYLSSTYNMFIVFGPRDSVMFKITQEPGLVYNFRPTDPRRSNTGAGITY